MRLDLREHDVRENAAGSQRRPLDHRRAGLVAGRFNPQHNHSGFHSIVPQTRSAFSARSLCSLPTLGLLPPPLAGEGWGGGIQQDSRVRNPPPPPPPQQGGGDTQPSAERKKEKSHTAEYTTPDHPRQPPHYPCFSLPTPPRSQAPRQ